MSLACLPAHLPLAPSVPSTLLAVPPPHPHPPPRRWHQPWDLCTCSSCGLVLCSLTYLRDSPPSFRSMFSPQLLREAFPACLWKTASSPPHARMPLPQSSWLCLPSPSFCDRQGLFCLLVPFLTYPSHLLVLEFSRAGVLSDLFMP